MCNAERKLSWSGKDDSTSLSSAEGDDDVVVADKPAAFNPFQSFAYNNDDAKEQNGNGIKKNNKRPVSSFSASASAAASSSVKGGRSIGTVPIKEKTQKKEKKQKCGPPADFQAMSSSEQKQVFRRWHNVCASARQRLINDGQSIDLETYRFQLLVAILLSTMTQEGVVIQAIAVLSSHSTGRLAGGLTLQTIRQLEGDRDISEHIGFVHCNKVKSRYIHSAAKLIHEKWNGLIPMDEKSVLDIPGIGPTLAPLLVFLYQYQQEHPEECDFSSSSSTSGGNCNGTNPWFFSAGAGRRLGGGSGGGGGVGKQIGGGQKKRVVAKEEDDIITIID